MLNKIILGLLILLFFFLSLINSHLFDLLGIEWGFYVEGNYEFTKLMFFNIFSGIILFLFFINKIFNFSKKSPLLKKGDNKSIIIPKIIIPIIIILLLSTYFSDFQYTSFFGNNSKSHSFLMFINIIGLYILFINIAKKDLKKIIFTTIISSIFVGIIGLKEYYFPTFDYGNLSNRAISTFGHPNYLALYILIITPLIINKIKFNKNLINIFYGLILFLLIFLLFLTKSIWGIFLFIIYLSYLLYAKILIYKKGQKWFIFGIFFLFTILLFIIYKFGLFTKLQSFISRFYIWETTLNIIFSNIKTFLFGGGLGTLDLIFEPFKVKELYIFENIGFTADRPHNIFLNYFYHFGILGFILTLYLLNKLFLNYKNNAYFHSIVLFVLFSIFNFPSISHYLIIILILGFIYKTNNKILNSKYLKLTLILFISLVSIFGSIFSINYYIYEYKVENNIIFDKKSSFIQNIKNEDLNYFLFSNGFSKIENKCLTLTKSIPSVENYFYCGNILWNINRDTSLKYYYKGLDRLPNMWDDNSKMYNNYLIKTLFTPKRFYSEKYSNIKEILKRVGK